jgi:citrate lyase subunit beta/citryl-CoA lyase
MSSPKALPRGRTPYYHREIIGLTMNTPLIHPRDALFTTTDPAFPIIAPCDHYAGSEKLMIKSLALQRELGPIFDITFDCEDGAAHGQTAEHRAMIARLLTSSENSFDAVGVRIHDLEHPEWRSDIEYFLHIAGDRLAHLTIPKARDYSEAASALDFVDSVHRRLGLSRQIPVHLLIESQGALRDIGRIAALPGLRGLDFGIMDFVSSHRGAIPSAAVRSPGQFEHRLVARAKAEIVAAALAHGLIPSHNVSLDLVDDASVSGDARRARNEFGFLRMWSIHPRQIRAILAAFAPDLTAACQAGEILLQAQQNGWGPIRFRDELYDRASYRMLWDTVQRAQKTGVALPDEVQRAFFGYPPS